MDGIETVLEIGKNLGSYGTVAAASLYGLYKIGEKLLTKYDNMVSRHTDLLKQSYEERAKSLEGTIVSYREELHEERQLLRENTRVLNGIVEKIGGVTTAINDLRVEVKDGRHDLKEVEEGIEGEIGKACDEIKQDTRVIRTYVDRMGGS